MLAASSGNGTQVVDSGSIRLTCPHDFGKGFAIITSKRTVTLGSVLCNLNHHGLRTEVPFTASDTSKKNVYREMTNTSLTVEKGCQEASMIFQT